jgi:hypothetical protein
MTMFQVIELLGEPDGMAKIDYYTYFVYFVGNTDDGESQFRVEFVDDNITVSRITYGNYYWDTWLHRKRESVFDAVVSWIRRHCKVG